MAKKKSGNAGKMLLAGIAAAAGTYFLYGAKEAKKHQKQVKSWMLKAKGDMLEQLEKMDMIDEAKYEAALAKVGKKYQKLKNIEPAEVEELLADMRKHWKHMVGSAPKKKR